MDAIASSMILLAALTSHTPTGGNRSSSSRRVQHREGKRLKKLSAAGAFGSSGRTYDVHEQANSRVKQKRVLLKFALRCKMQRDTIQKQEEDAFKAAYEAFEQREQQIKKAQEYEDGEFQTLFEELSQAVEWNNHCAQRLTRAEVVTQNKALLQRLCADSW